METERRIYKPTGGGRTNPKSNIPGGSTVIVHFEDYTVEYNNIKNVEAYTRHIMSKDPSIIKVTIKE